jgi:ligand-binding SRPBCC domain-containing protein
MELHQESTVHTAEKAVAGTTTGLLQLGEWVTWEAVHFGIRQHLTSKITQLCFPHHFRDEQIKGAFKYFKHDHYFKYVAGGTEMKDVFMFESPFGILGHIFNSLVLTRYMKKLLCKRNDFLKRVAESGEERRFLPTQK